MNEEVIKMAIDAITQEIEKAPTAQLYKERGRLRMMIKDEQGAMQDLREAIKLNPEVVNELQDGSFSGKIGSCH